MVGCHWRCHWKLARDIVGHVVGGVRDVDVGGGVLGLVLSR